MVVMGEGELDRTVDKREADVARREAALAARTEAAHEILDAAALRDVDAEARDADAAARDHARDLLAFVNVEDGDRYGLDNAGRREAAIDRGAAKEDRTSSADDRLKLTEDQPEESPEA